MPFREKNIFKFKRKYFRCKVPYLIEDNQRYHWLSRKKKARMRRRVAKKSFYNRLARSFYYQFVERELGRTYGHNFWRLRNLRSENQHKWRRRKKIKLMRLRSSKIRYNSFLRLKINNILFLFFEMQLYLVLFRMKFIPFFFI